MLDALLDALLEAEPDAARRAWLLTLLHDQTRLVDPTATPGAVGATERFHGFWAEPGHRAFGCRREPNVVGGAAPLDARAQAAPVERWRALRSLVVAERP